MKKTTSMSSSVQTKPMLSFLLLILLLGLYGSLKSTFHTSALEADFSDSAMLWLGWHQYGWKFFSSWNYTVDNWLLSLIPIHFLLFYLFGVKPLVVLLTGWAIFIASLLTLGLIAKTLRAPKTAILLPLCLLFINQSCYYSFDATYAITHNVTNFYGLLALLFTLKWLQNPRVLNLIIVFFAFFCAGISDPWLFASYVYPLLTTSILFLVVLFIDRENNSIKKYLPLIIITTLIIIFVRNKCFNRFYFLEKFRLELSSPTVMLQNTVYLFKLVGESFNIFPTFLLPAIWANIISCMLFFLLALNSCYQLAIQLLPKREWLLSFFSLFLFLSLCAISVSFIITFPKYENAGRYLINIIFLGPLLIALNLEWFWSTHSRKFKYFMYVIISLFLLASISSNIPVWKDQHLTFNNNNVPDLINFLNAHHLYQGYGPYWGSEANAITWITNEKIKLYPVMFSQVNGKIILGERAQTSHLLKFFPSNQSFFVFIKKDGEECGNLALCQHGVEKQFGKPSEILTYQDALIYVWKKEGKGYA